MRVIMFLALVAPILAFEIDVNQTPGMEELESRQGRIMEDRVIHFLECMRDVLKNGDKDTGFPSFDPLDVGEVLLNLNILQLQGLSGYLHFKDAHLSGVPRWDVDSLKVSITLFPVGAKLVGKATWPAVNVSGKYDFDAKIFGHVIRGAGALGGHLSELAVELDARAGIRPMKINSAKASVTLASSSLNIEGLIIDGKDASAAVSHFVGRLPTFFEETSDTLNQIIADVILPALNKILAIVNGSEGNAELLDYLPLRKCFPIF